MTWLCRLGLALLLCVEVCIALALTWAGGALRLPGWIATDYMKPWFASITRRVDAVRRR